LSLFNDCSRQKVITSSACFLLALCCLYRLLRPPAIKNRQTVTLLESPVFQPDLSQKIENRIYADQHILVLQYPDTDLSLHSVRGCGAAAKLRTAANHCLWPDHLAPAPTAL